MNEQVEIPQAQADGGSDQTETETTTASEQTSAAETPQESKTAGSEEEFVDVLGNGTLMKKVVTKGHGKRPIFGERVTTKVTMHIPELGKSFPEEEKTFTLCDGDVEQALDLVVALMEEGEKAIIIAGYKYMYGEVGLEPNVPPCSNFKLDVHLTKNHGVPDYPTMDFQTRFNEAKMKKERGNYYFRRRDYSLALTSYTKAGKIVDPNNGCVYTEESPENLQELLDFRAVVLCNTSAAQVRVEAYDAAVKSALEAIRLTPTYSKAYYRLGQAYDKMGQIDDCIRAYKQALKYDAENSKNPLSKPDLQIIHGELARLTKKNKNEKQSQQKMYSKMFWGSNPPTVNKEKVKDDTSVNPPHGKPTPRPSTSASTDKSTHNPGPAFTEPSAPGMMEPFNLLEDPGFLAGVQAAQNGLAMNDPQVIAALAALSQLIDPHFRKGEMKQEVQAKTKNPEEFLNKKEVPEKPVVLKKQEVLKSQEVLGKQKVPEKPEVLKKEEVLEKQGAPEKIEVPDSVESGEQKPKFSWLWKAGMGVIGAGLVGLAGIGLYRYMNH